MRSQLKCSKNTVTFPVFPGFFYKFLMLVILVYTDSVSFILMYLLSMLAIVIQMIVSDICLRHINTIENQLFKEMLITLQD